MSESVILSGHVFFLKNNFLKFYSNFSKKKISNKTFSDIKFSPKKIHIKVKININEYLIIIEIHVQIEKKSHVENKVKVSAALKCGLLTKWMF